MWTKRNLQQVIKEQMAERLLVVASNRQPFSHVARGGSVVCQRQPGGLVTALTPVLQTSGGTWIAVGTSPYDKRVLNPEGKVMLPPENPTFALRRIFLERSEVEAYYDGYCNAGLWPLAHVAYTRPFFEAGEWKAYQNVNRKFAEAILEEVGYRPSFVWVQDFHLTLAGKYLREANRSNIVSALFWHIPWPNPEVFGICPQKKEILEGLLAYDLLGFHTRGHCDNFLATLDREIECLIDRERYAVKRGDHETLIRPFPISVDYQALTAQAESEDTKSRMQQLSEDFSLGGKAVMVGVDRIDYTKGIYDKFHAVDQLLSKHTEYKRKFVLFQLGQVSRMHVQWYQELNVQLDRLAERINDKHADGSWVPIIYTREPMPYQDIIALYRMADICAVSSLHDGMNLVAKEFVSCRTDLGGTLILSQFTGAAREFSDAILINPYDHEAFSEAIAQALAMPREEREKRMGKMRQVVEKHNIYRWAGKVLSELLKFEFQEI